LLDRVLHRQEVADPVVGPAVLPVIADGHRVEDVAHRVVHRRVLVTERQRAVAVARQPDVRLPAEQRVRDVQLAVAEFEAVLETEDRGQPAAEILTAAQAPAVVRFRADRHADQVLAVGAAFV
jgi:hypothetical protein